MKKIAAFLFVFLLFSPVHGIVFIESPDGIAWSQQGYPFTIAVNLSGLKNTYETQIRLIQSEYDPAAALKPEGLFASFRVYHKPKTECFITSFRLGTDKGVIELTPSSQSRNFNNTNTDIPGSYFSSFTCKISKMDLLQLYTANAVNVSAVFRIRSGPFNIITREYAIDQNLTEGQMKVLQCLSGQWKVKPKTKSKTKLKSNRKIKSAKELGVFQ